MTDTQFDTDEGFFLSVIAKMEFREKFSIGRIYR